MLRHAARTKLVDECPPFQESMQADNAPTEFEYGSKNVPGTRALPPPASAGIKDCQDPTKLCQPPNGVTLAFKDPTVESSFCHWYNERAATQDKQAASVYLWMVALGSLLYLAIARFAPDLRPANVDRCAPLILVSWLGPGTHLALLALLPRPTYVAHRAAIVLALRLFYVAATCVHGFGQCGVAPLQDRHALAGGPAAALAAAAATVPGVTAAAAAAAAAGASPPPPPSPCPLESVFSALLWRSGIIGLVWWGAAFPLPFWQHIVLQAGSYALYAATLTPTVCAGLYNVRSGAAVLAGIESLAHGACGQLLAAVGAPGLAARFARRAAAAATAAMAAAASAARGSSSSSGGGSSGGCAQSLAFLQLLLGLALPGFVLYCFEARRRCGWWQGQQHQAQPPHSGAAPAPAAAAAAPAAVAAGSSGGSSLAGRAGSSASAGRAGSSSGAAAGGAGGPTRSDSSSSSSGSSAGSQVAAPAPAPAAPQHGGDVRASGADAPAARPQQQQQQQQQQVGPAAAGQGGSMEMEEWEEAFDAESAAAALPPSIREVFVLVLLVGLAWGLLGHWL